MCSSYIAPIVFFILFQFKHYFFDFQLQCGNKYMMGKFKPYPYYIGPLCLHSGVNGFGTLLTLNVFTTYLNMFEYQQAFQGIFWHLLSLNVGLGLFDFVTHCVIDRIKSSPNLLGRYTPNDKMFWLALGIDQGMHQLVYIVIYVIYTASVAILILSIPS